MKKTVTTILSLALAIVMVSSLSSGVILAKDHDDDDDDDRYRGREVVIFDCTKIPTVPVIFVSAADSSMGAPMIDATTDPASPTFCAQTFADLLNAKFKVEDITTLVDFGTGEVITRHTMIKK